MNNSFTARFCFKPEYRGHFGVERECFLMDGNVIVPQAVSVLNLLPQNGKYGYELSACQLEMRTSPSLLSNLYAELFQIEKTAAEAASNLGLKLEHIPVAPQEMSVEVYPDPTGRYARIAERLPQEVLLAACRVAAVHIHIGVRDTTEAIIVYNRLIKHFNELKNMGDTCNGQRMALYRLMAPDTLPQAYTSWEEFHEAMHARECEEDPRQCWDLIRISTHGTVEVRVFDSVPDIKRIVKWAQVINEIADIVP